MKSIKARFRIPGIGVLLVICNMVFSGSANAEELTMLFTGQTHAMLYQCSCPIERDGGVSRRATLANQIRKHNPNVLLLDSGDFFAGGLADEFTQNTQLDMLRTTINLKAMDIIKYDAVAVGPDEFNFGSDFLKKNIGSMDFPLVSCNIESAALGKAIQPYIIKEVSGLKIGITGVTHPQVKQKATDINFIEPKDALQQTIDELKHKGIDIIIVLSNLGDKENEAMAKDTPGIDILLNGFTKSDTAAYRMGQTIILNPSWQARKLGKIVLSLKDKKITDFKAELMRISDKIPDNPEVEKILPRCFSDSNCMKDGVRGACLNPAAANASCDFPKVKKINLTVITKRDCHSCNTETTIGYLKRYLPLLNVTLLYYPDARTDKLIKENGINVLPAYLISKDIKDGPVFKDLQKMLDEKTGGYLLNPQAGGISFLLNRPQKAGSLDLFFSIYAKDSVALLDAIKDFKPTLHFLAVETRGGFEALSGKGEVEEYLRGVCVQKYYPERFWDYISCRAKNITSSWWEICLPDADQYKIKTCAMGPEGQDLLRNNINLNRELRIMFGPTYLLENQELFGTQGIPNKASFEKIFGKNKR